MNEQNKYYVYAHKNNITKHIFYVGIGTGYRCKEIRHNRSPHYFNYISKYGDPIVEILHDGISYAQACELEIKYIKEFGRMGYEEYGVLVNKGSGGEVGARGMKHTDDWKQNHSKIMKQRSNTDEFKRKISDTHKNKIVSNETRQKISDSLKPINKQRVSKIKESLSKIDRGPAISKGRYKPILQLDKNDTIINEYLSKYHAEQATNIKGINNAVTGLAKTAGGFKWKYKLS